MGFKLPPLSSVRVFEAAARHGSFKKAAEELNITASAVSHAVQNLEDWLGVALFQRGGGKLGLTEPGAAYAVAVGEGSARSECCARGGRALPRRAWPFASCTRPEQLQAVGASHAGRSQPR